MADANRQNYTSLEKAALAECVLKYQHIIENKVTNSVTNKEKQNMWDLIEKEFNCIPGVTIRTAKQLYNCYRNLKRKATKRKAEERLELFRTGGGPAVTHENDNIDETLFAMGAITRPLENVYDSDHAYHMQTSYSDEYTIPNCEIDADDVKTANLGDGPKEMNEIEVIRPVQQEPILHFITQVKATDSPSQASGSQKSKIYSPMVETKADKPSKIIPTPKLLRKAKRQPPASNAAAAALVEHSELKSKFLTEEHELTMKLKKEEHEITMKYRKEEHELMMKYKTEEYDMKKEDHDIKMEILKKDLEIKRNILAVIQNDPKKINFC